MAETGRTDRVEATFCDANVVVRLLTQDVPGQARAAARALDGDGGVILTDMAVAEICYVLADVYELDRSDIAEGLAKVIALPGVDVADAGLLADALRIWTTRRVDFADAYLAALARTTEHARVMSFDRDFDRIEGVERVDPRTY